MATNSNGKPSDNGDPLSPIDPDYYKMMTGWEVLEKRLDRMEKRPFFRMKKTFTDMQNQQLYQSASSLGTGILGLGLGILLSRWLGAWTPFLIAAGLFIHGWGMYKLHYSGNASWSKLPGWLKISVGVCWLVLAGLLGWLLVKIFGN